MLPVSYMAWLNSSPGAILGLNGLVLACLICWGVWGIFDKKALERAPDWDVFMAMLLLELPQIPICYFLLNSLYPGWHIQPELWLWGGIGAILYGISMVAYLTALSRTEASYVLGFTAGYPLVAQILSITIMGEPLIMERVLGAVLISIGVFIIGGSGEAASKPAETDKQSNPGWFKRMLIPGCVAIATITWGGKALIDKTALNYGNALQVYFVEVALNSLIIIPLALFFLLAKRKPRLQSKEVWFYTGLSTVALAIGAWAYLAALATSSISYVITITGCYPLLMYGFTLLFLKERLNKKRLLGIALVVLGGLCVQLTQGG